MKAVFSDIDGTLSKGFVSVDFIRYLGAKGILDKKSFALHESLMADYKNGKIKYADLVPKWSQSVAECFNGFTPVELKAKANEFFSEWKKENIYSSTKPLIKLLKEKGYLVFLISAGWDYLAELVAKEIGADEAVGLEIKIENGKYLNITGNLMFLEKGKSNAIQTLIKQHKINLQKTIGLGDSIQDKAIFENVHKPIALNPSKELKEKALKENWYLATHENVLEMMGRCFNKEKK